MKLHGGGRSGAVGRGLPGAPCSSRTRHWQQPQGGRGLRVGVRLELLLRASGLPELLWVRYFSSTTSLGIFSSACLWSNSILELDLLMDLLVYLLM